MEKSETCFVVVGVSELYQIEIFEGSVEFGEKGLVVD